MLAALDSWDRVFIHVLSEHREKEHAGQVQGDATVISPREGLIIGLWRGKTSDGCRAEIVRCEETGWWSGR